MGESRGLVGQDSVGIADIELPRSVARKRSTDPAASMPVGTPREQQRALVRVICVDDHVVLVEGLKAQFAIDGQIRCVASLDSAEHLIDAVAEHRPDVVLLDIRMPKVDGIEVLRRIKADAKLRKLPVIMLTTTDDSREIARCHELGCNVYMQKPVDYDRFSEAIRSLGGFVPFLQIPRLTAG